MEDNKGPESSLMEAYGLYLFNGGTPEGFMSMTMDDIQMMYTSYTAMNRNNTKNIVLGIAKVIGRMFGEQDGD